MTGNEKKILLLSPCWYLFIVVSGNNYLPKGINGNTLYFTATGNVSVARYPL